MPKPQMHERRNSFCSRLAGLFLLVTVQFAANSIAADTEWYEFELDLGPQGKQMNRELYGYATLGSDKNIGAGDWGSWELTYTVGDMGIDDGGRIFLLTHITADWGLFQTQDPRAANFVTARTTGRAKNLVIDVNRRHAGPRPYWSGLEITVREGDLKAGDQVIVTLGDRSGGGPGARAPTITSHLDQEIRFMVDPMNAVNAVRVLDSPRVRTTAGAAVALETLWPSEAVAGETTWLLVKAKDKWGNPAETYSGQIEFDGPPLAGLPQSYRFSADDRGFHRFEQIEVPASGELVLRVFDTNKQNLAAETNVMVVKSNPELKLYCGDLHGQHLRDSASVEQYAGYARGFGGAEFMSWAKNDFHVSKKDWDDIQRASKAFDEAERFVVFPGYEWSGTTGRGGDHNVIYLDQNKELYRSGYVEEDLRGYDPANDRYSIDTLVSSLDSREAFLMPHIGGRRANLDFYDSEFMPFIEIYSAHGQFEWFLKDALKRGLKVGFTASSDDAYGKLGDSIPGDRLFAVHGGITCVYASDLSRRSLWQAFKSRRVYGTTGERIQLRFTAGGHWLGEEINPSGPVSFNIEASGTSGVDRVDLFRGDELIYTHRGSPETPADRIKVVWRGAASMERARQTIWQGSIALSEGRITDSQRYRLDYPVEVIQADSEQRVVFDTITAGDEDGVVLSLDAPANATLSFDGSVSARNQFGEDAGNFRRIEFSIPIGELTQTEAVFDAGGLERQVAVSKVGKGYPRTVSFSWREPDEQLTSGAYWVRVKLEDGAMAWSSPIFVER